MAVVVGRADAQAPGAPTQEIWPPPGGIRAPPLSARAPLRADPSRLPSAVRGKFPSYDGDSFAFTMPARSGDALAPRATFDEVIVPLMRAMGFEARVPSVGVPQSGGVFQQLEAGVPIETAAVIVTPTSVHGTLFNRYRLANRATMSSDAAIRASSRDLVSIDRAELVLLPYGNDADGTIVLRHAYRTLLAARGERSRTWRAWIDAEAGRILQLAPQFEKE